MKQMKAPSVVLWAGITSAHLEILKFWGDDTPAFGVTHLAPVARFLGTHTHTLSLWGLCQVTSSQAVKLVWLSLMSVIHPSGSWSLPRLSSGVRCLPKRQGHSTARIKWILSSGHSVVLDKIDYLYNLDFLGGMIPRQEHSKLPVQSVCEKPFHPSKTPHKVSSPSSSSATSSSSSGAKLSASYATNADRTRR